MHATIRNSTTIMSSTVGRMGGRPVSGGQCDASLHHASPTQGIGFKDSPLCSRQSGHYFNCGRMSFFRSHTITLLLTSNHCLTGIFSSIDSSFCNCVLPAFSKSTQLQKCQNQASLTCGFSSESAQFAQLCFVDRDVFRSLCLSSALRLRNSAYPTGFGCSFPASTSKRS